MKTVNINFVCLILIAFVISCDKSERYDDPEPIDSISTFRLEISLNGTPYKDYLFTTDEILEENIFTQDSKTKKVKYSWNDFRSIQRKDYYDSDSVGFNYKIDSIFYDENMLIDYIIPYSYTDDCNCYYNPNIYILMEYDEQDFLSKYIEYDSTYAHYLILSFVYENNNVSQKYYPLESGLPQYTYEYDDKNSIFQLLNLPKIDELAISDNNITKVSVRSQSMTWDESTGDPIYSTSEYELYSSDFIYDSLDFPVQEIRYSSTSIDTFTYKIIEVE